MALGHPLHVTGLCPRRTVGLRRRHLCSSLPGVRSAPVASEAGGPGCLPRWVWEATSPHLASRPARFLFQKGGMIVLSPPQRLGRREQTREAGRSVSSRPGEPGEAGGKALSLPGSPFLLRETTARCLARMAKEAPAPDRVSCPGQA